MLNVPGEALLRALHDVITAVGDPESEIRAAVDAFCVRWRDAKAESEFLGKRPDQGDLVAALQTLEGACRGFHEALEVYVFEWPSPFPPPPDVLIAAVAAVVVSAEFRVACARANIKRMEEDHGTCVH